MSVRTVQLLLHYDGSAFAGWQIQPEQRTVQGELERVLAELCGERIVAQGAGRTDAGVHARGQAVGVKVPEKWQAATLHRAVNALLPKDVWVAAAYEMRPDFHARYKATARRYAYYVGTDATSRSPFRRRWEWSLSRPIDAAGLHAAASQIPGTRQFRAFAVRGTAPADDDHRCSVTTAEWQERDGGLIFRIEANRFLHHMVRFLVGTMIDIAGSRRPPEDMTRLLEADTNDEVSAPAPPHGLFLEEVRYPREFYISGA